MIESDTQGLAAANREADDGATVAPGAAVLEMVLYEMRLRFVEAQGEEKRIITP